MLKNETEYLDDEKTFHGSVPYVMGTRLEAILVGALKEESIPVWHWLCVEVERFDCMLNRFNPESELSKANASGNFENVSAELHGLILLAEEYKKRTSGLFDVSKGGRELDFGGFAKGFVLHRFRDILAGSGISSAFVDFGGSSILAAGHHPFGDCWKIGVRNPFDRKILKELELRDQSMSTSGNTPGHSGHIINPATGEPNHERKVVTVVGPDPLDVEVLSTAAMLADDARMAELKNIGLFGKTEFYAWSDPE